MACTQLFAIDDPYRVSGAKTDNFSFRSTKATFLWSWIFKNNLLIQSEFRDVIFEMLTYHSIENYNEIPWNNLRNKSEKNTFFPLWVCGNVVVCGTCRRRGGDFCKIFIISGKNLLKPKFIKIKIGGLYSNVSKINV